MAIGIRILKFVVIWARGLFLGALLLFLALNEIFAKLTHEKPKTIFLFLTIINDLR